MRCLVTGASGHVGSFLTAHLLDRGCEVAALVRPQSDLWRLSKSLGPITILRGDMGDLETIREPLKRWQPEIVFHLAWQGVTGEYRNDTGQITHNVTGSLALFDMALTAGCRVWVGVGSQAEYGHYDGLMREDLPANPITAYGVAKLCTGMLTEKLCAMTGTRFLWLRLLATYGPMDDPRHLLPAVIEQLLARKRPALTPGEQHWDYLYIDDAVDAIVRLALDTDAQGTFNLGSGQTRQVRQWVETARDLINPSLPLGFGDIPYRPDQIMRLQADITKLQTQTGWQPRVSMEEGLRRTIDWHRALSPKEAS